MMSICAIDPHGIAWTTSRVTTCSDCILQCHCKHLMFLCVCPMDITPLYSESATCHILALGLIWGPMKHYMAKQRADLDILEKVSENR